MKRHYATSNHWEISIDCDFDAMICDTPVLVAFTRTIVVEHDPNADCDADGRRGRAETWIDEDRAENITVEFDGGKAIDAAEFLSPKYLEVVEKLVSDYCEQHDPRNSSQYFDACEYDGPDTWEEYRGER